MAAEVDDPHVHHAELLRSLIVQPVFLEDNEVLKLVDGDDGGQPSPEIVVEVMVPTRQEIRLFPEDVEGPHPCVDVVHRDPPSDVHVGADGDAHDAGELDVVVVARPVLVVQGALSSPAARPLRGR